MARTARRQLEGRHLLFGGLRGKHKKGRGRGEGEREKGRAGVPSPSPQSPSRFSLPPYPLSPTPFDACYAGYYLENICGAEQP